MSPLVPVAAKHILLIDHALFAATGANGDDTLRNLTYKSDVAVQSSLRRDKPDGGGRLHGNRLDDHSLVLLMRKIRIFTAAIR
jgi:hypothetical protein